MQGRVWRACLHLLALACHPAQMALLAGQRSDLRTCDLRICDFLQGQGWEAACRIGDQGFRHPRAHAGPPVVSGP